MLTRLQLAIMELVVQRPVAANLLLLQADAFVAQWNRAHLKVDPREVLGALGQLVEQGLLYLSRLDGKPVAFASVEWNEYLTQQVRSNDAVKCRLTSQGGSLWEQAALPHWGKFYRLEWDHHSRGTLDVCRLEVIERILALEAFQEMAIFQHSPEPQIELVPWQATYWKAMPRGFRVTFTGWKCEGRRDLFDALGISGDAAQARYTHRINRDHGFFEGWFIPFDIVFE